MKIFLKKKGPVELVASTDRNLKILLGQKDDQKSTKSAERANEKLSSNLAQFKVMLYGDGESQPSPDATKRVVDELFRTDLLGSLLEHIQKLEFEARKDVANIYNFVLRQRKEEMVAYITACPMILTKLVGGYAEPDIALNCGAILREVIRHEELNSMLLHNSELFSSFFGYVQLSTFDVASDAFSTFKMMLTRHATSCSRFLDSHFNEVFEQYNGLLVSSNYVAKRQSLKLLAELLLKRTNYPVMLKYISSAENLKIIMNLLRGTTRALQCDAFHVFKIFVVNPKKSRPVLELLVRHRDKLIDFLRRFQSTKEEEQLIDEKTVLLALEKLDASLLEPPAPSPAASPPAAAVPSTSTTTCIATVSLMSNLSHSAPSAAAV